VGFRAGALHFPSLKRVDGVMVMENGDWSLKNGKKGVCGLLNLLSVP